MSLSVCVSVCVCVCACVFVSSVNARVYEYLRVFLRVRVYPSSLTHFEDAYKKFFWTKEGKK